MSRESEQQNRDQNLNLFWDYFYTDRFNDAYDKALELKASSITETELDLAIELQAKILLRQGQFRLAQEILNESKKETGFKEFVNFLIDANPKHLLNMNSDDPDTLVYKSQTYLLNKIYWGENYLANLDISISADDLVQTAFEKLLDQENYDKAILAAIQSLELHLEDQLLSHDLQLPIIHEQLESLIKLAEKTKYESTKAKLFLIKAKIFKDREAAEDAEILFGKEKNKNGLAETYMLYAKEFGEVEYYEKALDLFTEVNNKISQGFIYESLASLALVNGEIQDAAEFFEKAKTCLTTGGLLEELGLEIQRISLLAIKGKYQKVKEAIHDLIKPNIPSFFIAQSYQILANTLIQLGEDTELAKGYIETSCDIFKDLKRYNQLLYTQNIYFQILLLENDLDLINKCGQEIIQLATRLGNEEIKASKYLDLAFVTIRVSLEEGSLNNAKLEEATEFFKKAIKLYQEQDNLIGEADTYQAMGNMFTGIGKLEDALNAFLTAKKLYNSEKALLQAAITDTLIGILMLNYVVLNEQTYPIAQRHLEQALVYFSKENLLDLAWKATFYLADLNHKYYIINKDNLDLSELHQNKAKNYYAEMLAAVEDYESEAPHLTANQASLVGVTIEDAFNKAYQFFLSIGEDENAKKFRRQRPGLN